MSSLRVLGMTVKLLDWPVHLIPVPVMISSYIVA
jgi:hypothetical protein